MTTDTPPRRPRGRSRPRGQHLPSLNRKEKRETCQPGCKNYEQRMMPEKRSPRKRSNRVVRREGPLFSDHKPTAKEHKTQHPERGQTESSGGRATSFFGSQTCSERAQNPQNGSEVRGAAMQCGTSDLFFPRFAVWVWKKKL